MSDLSIVEVTPPCRHAATYVKPNGETGPIYCTHCVPKPAPSEVTQADRDAAEAFFPTHLWKDEARADVALAFARHRASEAERVREACAKVCDQVEQQQDNDHGAANTGGAAACGAAIRSLPIGEE